MQISLLLQSSNPRASATVLHAIRVITAFPKLLPRRYYLNPALNAKSKVGTAHQHRAAHIQSRLFLLHRSAAAAMLQGERTLKNRFVSSFEYTATVKSISNVASKMFPPVRKITIQQCCRVQLQESSNSAGFYTSVIESLESNWKTLHSRCCGHFC
jgi:hypothetical protein